MIIEIKAVPASGRSGWIIDKNGQIKCYLKSPPERGLANQELIKTVAKALNIPQGAISIVSVITSPKKRLKIDAQISYQEFMRAVGLEEQRAIF